MRIDVQFGAQTLDMRIDRAVIAEELITPDHRQQVIAREHAPRRRGCLLYTSKKVTEKIMTEFSDLNLCPINNRQGIVIDGEGSKVICKD